MQTKKVIIGVLGVVLLSGGAFAYSSSEGLQGRVRGGSLSSTPSVTTTTRPDFYFNGAVSYDSEQNAFSVSVCRTNVASADVKLTSLKFRVARGQEATVQFTPTVTTAASCQTVRSGDLLDTLLIAQSGSYDVTATVDTTSVQTETSETNNTLTTTGVVVASGGYPYLYDSANLPDLTVDDVEFTIMPSGRGEDGDDTYMLAIVCGVDDLLSYPSKGNVEYSYHVSQNGVTLENGESSLYPDPFSATSTCGEFVVDLDWVRIYPMLNTGTVTMNMQLDVMDNVPESNEDNNGFSQTFTSEIVIE